MMEIDFDRICKQIMTESRLFKWKYRLNDHSNGIQKELAEDKKKIIINSLDNTKYHRHFLKQQHILDKKIYCNRFCDAI